MSWQDTAPVLLFDYWADDRSVDTQLELIITNNYRRANHVRRHAPQVYSRISEDSAGFPQFGQFRQDIVIFPTDAPAGKSCPKYFGTFEEDLLWCLADITNIAHVP
jgi:hypothetical protein